MIQTLFKKRIYYPNQTVSSKSTDFILCSLPLEPTNYWGLL